VSLASKGGGEEVEEGESCDLQIRRTTKKKKKTERDDSEKISKLSFGIMFLLLSCSFSTFFFFFFFLLATVVRFLELGREDGLAAGVKNGAIEGRVMGCEKGFELSREVGYYAGCALLWKALAHQDPERISDK